MQPRYKWNIDNLAEPGARQLIENHSDRAAFELFVECRKLADKRRDQKVKASHVIEILQRYSTPKTGRKRIREFLIFLGGAFFSVLIQTLLTTPDEIDSIQAIFGVIGLVLVFVSLLIET